MANKESDETTHLEISDTLITCQICMDVFDSPRILPCQHTYCKKCVIAIIDKNCLDSEGRVQRSTFPCPSCRRDCKIRHKGRFTIDEHLKPFPENLIVKQLLDSKRDSSAISSNTGKSDKGTRHNRRPYFDQYLDESDVVSSHDSLSDAYIRYAAFLKLLIAFVCKLDKRFAFSESRSFQGVTKIEFEKFVRSLCRTPFIPTQLLDDEPHYISVLEDNLRTIIDSLGGFWWLDFEPTRDASAQTEHLRMFSLLTVDGFELFGIFLFRIILFLERACLFNPVLLLLHLTVDIRPTVEDFYILSRIPKYAYIRCTVKVIDVAITLHFSQFSFTTAFFAFLVALIVLSFCTSRFKSFPEINFVFNNNKHVLLVSTCMSLCLLSNIYRCIRMYAVLIAVYHYDFRSFGIFVVIEVLQLTAIIIISILISSLLLNRFVSLDKLTKLLTLELISKYGSCDDLLTRIEQDLKIILCITGTADMQEFNEEASYWMRDDIRRYLASVGVNLQFDNMGEPSY